MIVINFSEMNRLMRRTDRIAMHIQKAEEQLPKNRPGMWRMPWLKTIFQI